MYVLYKLYFKGTTIVQPRQPPPIAATKELQKSLSSDEPVAEPNATNNKEHATEVSSLSPPAVPPQTKPKPV